MSVRPYKPDDAAALATIFRRAVTEIGAKDYTPEQVEAWAGHTPSVDGMKARNGDGRTVLVFVDAADQPLGWIDLEADGHIDTLYCAPEVVGQGAASALYDAIETLAREQGLVRLYTEASEAARRLFLKKGFTETQRRDFPIAHPESQEDVWIHNYAMEKDLTELSEYHKYN